MVLNIIGGVELNNPKSLNTIIYNMFKVIRLTDDLHVVVLKDKDSYPLSFTIMLSRNEIAVHWETESYLKNY
jgi:hypothetical protein